MEGTELGSPRLPSCFRVLFRVARDDRAGSLDILSVRTTHVTLEDLPLGISKLRNRVIGRVFQELRLVEQWGSGVQRMLAACRDAGLRPPVWEEVGHRLRVTMWTERVGEIVTDEIDTAILDALDTADGLGTRAVADVIGLSTRATRNRLGRLVERGLVVEVGTGPRDPKREYHRAGS